jgi:hypothetical protein
MDDAAAADPMVTDASAPVRRTLAERRSPLYHRARTKWTMQKERRGVTYTSARTFFASAVTLVNVAPVAPTAISVDLFNTVTE